VGAGEEEELFTDVNWAEVLEAEFRSCTFIGCDFSGAQIRKSRFVDCHFQRCDLSLFKPTDSVFGGSRFEDCRMLGVDWTMAVWARVPLHEPTVFVRCDLSLGTFTDLDLALVTFEECRLREVSYRNARLVGARFQGSDCEAADFLGADLTDACLTGVRGLWVDPRTTKLEGATVDATSAVVILESLGINLDWNEDDVPPRRS
jgi:uncharacterized protein YjbI with pentapeptide repeats